MDLPLRKYKLTSQNQPYTALIDWLEIYDSYVNSNLTYKKYYAEVFPNLIKKIMPEGYLPSITTFKTHIQKIKKEGKEEYQKRTRGFANYKGWNNIYDEYIASGLTMNKFYDLNIYKKVRCARNTFYRQMNKIKEEREQMITLDPKEHTVNIVSLNENQIDSIEKNINPQSLVTENRNKAVIVNIKLINNAQISFESTNPEYSVAKIIATLERL